MKVNEVLIKNCINGERISHKALYEECAPYVYAIVKNYVNDSGFHKDAMQESFASIFSSLSRYKSEKGSFKSWIARIAVNKCIDILKKTGRIGFSDGLEMIMEIPDEDFERMNQLSTEEIEGLLKTMPDGYRTVFLLSVIDGYTHKEIARMLQITTETSRSQRSRAIQWLRKNLVKTSNNFIYEAL